MRLWKRLAGVLFGVLLALPATAGETMTVTDLSGQSVTLQVPLKRIVLMSSRSVHEFAAVLGDDFLKPVVGWAYDLEMMDRDSYDHFASRYPAIADVPDVGYTYKNTFSVEKVIALTPDAVFMPLWMSKSTEEDRAKLKAAGIPVVVLDFWKEPLDNPPASLRLMGRLFGKEARAEEIASVFEESVARVETRLAGIKTAPPSVYIETGFKGPQEYSTTYGDNGWGAVVKRSGGLNIAEGVIERTGQINPEYLLSRDPDHIIIPGSYWPKTPGAMRIGYFAEKDDSVSLLKGFEKRSGWESLKAVKQGKVHSIYHGFCFHLYNFVAMEAFAKWFYPEAFADLDPEADLRSFHERFMPVPYRGVWILDSTRAQP